MTEYEKELLAFKRNENALKAIELKCKLNIRANTIYDTMLNQILYESGFDPNNRKGDIRDQTS